MEGATTDRKADPGQGRLPTPVANAPISQQRFETLVERWRTLGVWLSMWNRDGQLVAMDEAAGPFWETLFQEGNAFAESLTSMVRQSLDSKAKAGEAILGPDGLIDLGPWTPDLGIVAAPVVTRRRQTGVVLGAFLLQSEPDEAFARLCDRCKLDRSAMLQLIDRNGVVSQPARAIADILALSVEQARDIEVRQQEIKNLTGNLENTYEELHLIYEISHRLGIPQDPSKMVEQVGQEMLEVSRAKGLGFFLIEDADVNKQSASGETETQPDVSDRVVRVGDGAPTDKDIRRLTVCLSSEFEASNGQLLLNNAASRDGLKWAADWLNHLVVIPLRLEGRFLGVFHAINCDDGGDFTSVDVQLFRAVADRVTAALQNQKLYDDLTSLLMGLLHALVNSVDAKDPYTFGHSERVAFFSRRLAQSMSMSAIDCERVYLAGLLHDLGKIGVPDAILCKPGRLTREEFDALKNHPKIGERILSRIPQIRDLLPGILNHHERMDGRGYPMALAGRRIPTLGRIICLADSFDAMTTNRTYRAALPVAAAIAEIRRCAGTQFDPVLAEAFLETNLHKQFEDAHSQTFGVLDLGRIGALNAVIGGYPQWCSRANAAARQAAAEE